MPDFMLFHIPFPLILCLPNTLKPSSNVTLNLMLSLKRYGLHHPFDSHKIIGISKYLYYIVLFTYLFPLLDYKLLKNREKILIHVPIYLPQYMRALKFLWIQSSLESFTKKITCTVTLCKRLSCYIMYTCNSA